MPVGSKDFSHGEERPPWDASRTTQPGLSPTGIIPEDCWYYQLTVEFNCQNLMADQFPYPLKLRTPSMIRPWVVSSR